MDQPKLGLGRRPHDEALYRRARLIFGEAALSVEPPTEELTWFSWMDLDRPVEGPASAGLRGRIEERGASA